MIRLSATSFAKLRLQHSWELTRVGEDLCRQSTLLAAWEPVSNLFFEGRRIVQCIGPCDGVRAKTYVLAGHALANDLSVLVDKDVRARLVRVDATGSSRAEDGARARQQALRE